MTFRSLDRGGLIIRTAPLGVIATNSYIIGCEATGTGAVVDSCAQADVIDAMVSHTPALAVAHLLQTHAHIDHVAALVETKARYGAPISIHRDEMTLYEAAPMQGRMFGIHTAPLPAPDIFWEDGDRVALGELEGEVILTPGHTPGGCCVYFEAQGVLFSGDLLFAGSIGRTDLPGGHTPTIFASLVRLMERLPDETLVLSGHGPETTIGLERRRNPFVEMAYEAMGR